MKKLIAAIIFLVAAFFGAGTQSDLYGDISLFMSLLIVLLSFSLMGYTVSLWKSQSKKEEDEESN